MTAKPCRHCQKPMTPVKVKARWHCPHCNKIVHPWARTKPC